MSKIANVDFPERWPTLLPSLLQLIPNANDAQLHGSLKVLADLVEDSLSEDQFFQVARDILKVVYDVATTETRKPLLRALAVSVFRGTFDIMEIVKDEHESEVKAVRASSSSLIIVPQNVSMRLTQSQFAEEILNAWSPFFMDTMKRSLPARSEGTQIVPYSLYDFVAY